MKLVAMCASQPRQTKGIPHARCIEEFAVVFICNCEVVDRFHLGGLPKMLYGGNKSFGPRVESMLGLWLVVFFAPDL